MLWLKINNRLTDNYYDEEGVHDGGAVDDKLIQYSADGRWSDGNIWKKNSDKDEQGK